MFKRFLGVALSAILVLPIMGQEATPAGQPATNPEQVTPEVPPPPPPSPLTIEVIAGQGAVNDVVSGEATAPRVMVLDEQGQPVSGIVVQFRTPAEGPSGIFSSWILTQTVRTDASGVAATTQYAPNDEVGDFAIQVTASGENRIGMTTIGQSNAEVSQRPRSNKFKVTAIAVGVVVGGIVAGAIASDR